MAKKKHDSAISSFQVKNLYPNSVKSDLNNKWLIRKHDKSLIIDKGEILYLKAQGAFTVIRTIQNYEEKISYSMGFIQNQFSQIPFFRVNRSIILNINTISEISTLSKSKTDPKYLLKFSNGHSFEISRRFQAKLMQILEENLFYYAHGPKVRSLNLEAD